MQQFQQVYGEHLKSQGLPYERVTETMYNKFKERKFEVCILNLCGVCKQPAQKDYCKCQDSKRIKKTMLKNMSIVSPYSQITDNTFDLVNGQNTANNTIIETMITKSTQEQNEQLDVLLSTRHDEYAQIVQNLKIIEKN